MDNLKTENPTVNYELNGTEPQVFLQWLTGMLQPKPSEEVAETEIFINFTDGDGR